MSILGSMIAMERQDRELKERIEGARDLRTRGTSTPAPSRVKIFTITAAQLRWPHYFTEKCSCCGHTKSYHGLGDAIGRVQRRDIGKRAYLRDGIFQVESDDQRDARLERARMATP